MFACRTNNFQQLIRRCARKNLSQLNFQVAFASTWTVVFTRFISECYFNVSWFRLFYCKNWTCSALYDMEKMWNIDCIDVFWCLRPQLKPVHVLNYHLIHFAVCLHQISRLWFFHFAFSTQYSQLKFAFVRPTGNKNEKSIIALPNVKSIVSKSLLNLR